MKRREKKEVLLVGYETLIAFAVFTLGGVAVYSAVPMRFKKYALLFVSLACFSYLARLGVIILLIESAVTYYAARVIDGVGKHLLLPEDKEEKKKQKQKIKKRKQIIFALYAVFMIAMLVLFKNLGSIFAFCRDGAVFKILLNTSVLSSVGMSYYTLQAIGYVLDVERKTVKSEESFCDVLLFCSFFPQLNEGPFSRAKDLMPQLKNCEKLKLANAQSGVAELLLGLFKLFVIADRAGIAANAVFSDYKSYSGIEILWGVLAFTLQLYADFSGYINIASGVSKIFGITLPQNFNLPFASQSVGEFWRRWHISLGAWFRDYVFYGISVSRPIKLLTKRVKGGFGRVLGVFITLSSVWLLTGLWHGFELKYAFYGMYYCIIILFETLLESKIKPKTEKGRAALKIVGVIKTFIFVNIGMLIFKASSIGVAAEMLKNIFKPSKSFAVPGMEVLDLCVLGVATALLAAGGIMSLKGFNFKAKYDSLSSIKKYWLCFLTALIIAVFGAYGMGYLPPDPIYGGF